MDRFGAGPVARDRRRPDFRSTDVLILSRREGEVVVVPQCRLEIVVRSIEGDRVRLGFLAPDETAIYRQEIWQEMCFEDFNNRSRNDGTED